MSFFSPAIRTLPGPFEVTKKPYDEYNPKNGKGAFAIELGTTSISSGNSNERTPTEKVIAHEEKIVNSALNPHLKYANLRDHGYLLITLTKKEIKADYVYVKTLKERNTETFIGKTVRVKSGKTQIK